MAEVNADPTNVAQVKQVNEKTQADQNNQLAKPGPEKKPKDWVAALLLSIFSGSLGIDRFYLGYTWQGVLKLITFGGFGIWWIIDLILIATKHDFSKVEWIK